MILLLITSLIGLSSQNVVTLQSGDIKEIIFNSEDPWLLFIEQSIEDAKKTKEKHPGLFRVGYITRSEYVKETKIKLKETTKYISYPYGIEKKKKRKDEASSLKDIINIILKNIPDHVVKLPNKFEGQNERLRGFFQDAYLTTPTRFPAVFFTDKEETPVELKMLALKYSTLFYFGVIKKPSKETLKQYSVDKLPYFNAYIVDNLKDVQPRIKIMKYHEQFFGPLNYATLVRFLYLLHKHHFKELPLWNVNKADIDLDSMFFDDLQQFRDIYMKDQVTEPQKNEL